MENKSTSAYHTIQSLIIIFISMCGHVLLLAYARIRQIHLDFNKKKFALLI